MRSSNPVFSRQGAFTRDTGYAGFGPSQSAGPHAPQSPPPGGPYAGGPYANNPYDQQPLSAEQLQQMYGAPAAGPLDTGRMTMDDVVARTAMTLLTLVAAGALAWFAVPAGAFGIPMVAALAAFVIAMVVSFRRTVSPALVLAYAALEGVFLGAISKALDVYFSGIAVQAVLGTAAVFAGMLVAYRSGRIRVTARYQRIGLAVAMGFVLLLVVNMVAALFGADLGLRSGPVGILVGVLGICLGAFFLSLDFHEIEQGVRGGAPEREAWRAAFGLTLSLVWIYLEMLRLIAILRGDD
ncbi:Bax inhibitor-1/YccA family protein [Streptomyces sp. NPDC001380]|uniref:Bax inhibitor-1/YccA family protein n=1 Tax=Streptomyces sp. NPDC001380 TaxID=3364566 RepID=UPI003676FE22